MERFKARSASLSFTKVSQANYFTWDFKKKKMCMNGIRLRMSL